MGMCCSWLRGFKNTSVSMAHECMCILVIMHMSSQGTWLEVKMLVQGICIFHFNRKFQDACLLISTPKSYIWGFLLLSICITRGSSAIKTPKFQWFATKGYFSIRTHVHHSKRLPGRGRIWADGASSLWNIALRAFCFSRCVFMPSANRGYIHLPFQFFCFWRCSLT